MADLKEILKGKGINRDSVKNLFQPNTVEDFVFHWLEDKVNEVVQNIKDHKKEASFKLEQSVRFQPVDTGQGFRFQFIMEDYWIYVNDGRAAGKMPPLEPIINWIYNKPDFKSKIGGTRSGLKEMKIKTLGDISAPSNVLSAAYGIGMSMKKKAVKPTNFYSSVINDQSLSELRKNIEAAFKKDVEVTLVKIATDANKK